ncbi:MAG: hypothetical protein AABX07_06145 [Nanoarchaeota archaeon]
MKKRAYFYLPALISLFLVFYILVFSFLARAQTIDPQQIVNDKINEVSKNVEDLKSKYLEKEWSDMIAKNKILGPIHIFLKENVLIKWLFLVLFNTTYSLSPLCFLTIVVCILFATLVGDSLRFYGFERFSSALIGLSAMVITVQLGVINWLLVSLIDFISAKDAWWMRILFWVLVIVLIVLIGKTEGILSKFMQKREKEDKEEDRNQKIAEAEEFIKGVKEGQEISDKIKGKNN